MAYTMKTQLANKANYGSTRSTFAIDYIVIHNTGNDGDTDESNAKYFQNNVTKTSAHYFVDDDSVTQTVPDNYTAYAVGGSKYSNCDKTGGGKLYGKCKNSNSISIELCDTVKNGVLYPSAKTIANAIELTRSLMKKYNIPVGNVIRHFDVNGKSCPAYWCGTTEKNAKWLTEFRDKLTASSTTTVNTTQSSTQPLTVTANIKSVQTYLNAYYGDSIKKIIGAKLAIDGSAGAKTKKALAIAFQAEMNKLGAGISVDGSFGSKSSTAFNSKVGKLQKGSTGIFVTLWQCLLVCFGEDPNGIDGKFGNGCVSATNSLFTAKKLSKDSIVNGSDINALI